MTYCWYSISAFEGALDEVMHLYTDAQRLPEAVESWDRLFLPLDAWAALELCFCWSQLLRT